jgi:mannose-6-phosphate isomerase-like protein (cupin superfamily)
MQEIFVMMIGTARLTVGDQTIIMRPGDAVLIEPRETHQMWNDGDLDAEYLAIGIAGDGNGQTVVVESA